MLERTEPYEVGDTVILTATFRTAEGQVADPDQVQLRIRRPSLVIDEMQPVKKDTGVYRAEYDLTDKPAGEYRYRWQGTGAVKAARRGTFQVQGNGLEA